VRSRLDEEAIVLGIEDGGLVVLAGECAHGLERIPEREHHELGLFIDVAAQHPHAVVAGRARVRRDPGLAHVLDVGVSVFAPDRSAPDPGDHRQS
jgi:hypothetical protein